MNTKQWDKDIVESIKHKTALDLINEYWDKRRQEVYKEVKEEIEKNDKNRLERA